MARDVRSLTQRELAAVIVFLRDQSQIDAFEREYALRIARGEIDLNVPIDIRSAVPTDHETAALAVLDEGVDFPDS
jgi:hypothetical protein